MVKESLASFIDDVRNGIQQWHDRHTDQDAWFESWFEDTTPWTLRSYYDHSSVGNDFFSFDVREASNKRYAEALSDFMEYCPNCGFVESGIHDCDEETEGITVEQAMEYISELGETPPADYIYDALYYDCWEMYCENTIPSLQHIIGDCEAVLERIDSAEEPEDLILALHMALSLSHYSGNMADDYCGLDDRVVNQIRANGLTSVFPREEILEFLG